MAGRALRMALLMLGMLAMVHQTMQLRLTNPLPDLEALEHDDKGSIGDKPKSYFGVILSSTTNLKALRKTGLFKFSAYVDIAGRRFHVGRLGTTTTRVVVVVGGSISAQAAVTTQILIEYFPTRAIVHLGSALTIDNSLPVGSVSVVRSAAFTGLWTWERLVERLGEAVSQLSFGEYGFPNPGLNYLGRIRYEKVKVFGQEYTPKPKKAFWHDVDSDMYEIAKYIKNVDLKQCFNSTHCLPKKPEIVYGLNASTSDIYVENPYYAKFLHDNFKVSTVDKGSATIIMTANANGVPVAVFRAATSSLNATYDSDFSYLGSYNGALVAAEFISLFPAPTMKSSY